MENDLTWRQGHLSKWALLFLSLVFFMHVKGAKSATTQQMKAATELAVNQTVSSGGLFAGCHGNDSDDTTHTDVEYEVHKILHDTIALGSKFYHNIKHTKICLQINVI